MTAHCRACGTALPAAPPVTCPACGARDWGNAKPCAAALVVREGNVLLTRRAHAPWQGLWCAPSGFCEGPEHPILAAEREVLEETGLAARVVAYLGTWVSPYADVAADAFEHVSVQYYAAEPLVDAEPAPDPAEVAELGWFSLDAPPTGLAPQDALPAALAALRALLVRGTLRTSLADRPGTPL